MVDKLQVVTGQPDQNQQVGTSGFQINPHPGGAAIVLSGGGAKGDFEVGAVRCLYNHGIRPNILCGTSVGSVNALKLAEGETTGTSLAQPAGHLRGLAGLERIWLGLNVDQDMWELEPGVAAIFDAFTALPAEAKAVESQASTVGSETILGIIGSLFGVPGAISYAPQMAGLSALKDSASTILAKLATTLQDAGNIQGLANYDPLEKLMRKPANFFAAMQETSGIKLRLAMVALEDGALRYVTETNTLVERNGQPTVVLPAHTPAEIAKLKADIAKLKTEKTQLAAAMKTAEAKGDTPSTKQIMDLLSVMQQLPVIEIQLILDSVPMDVIRAAIASSSLPVICRPTYMQDGRTYVDGGIRTLAPIQSAIDAGASNVYAVAAGSRRFDSRSLTQIASSTPLPLLGIALRVGEAILPDEVGRRDLFPDNPYPVPVMVIQPEPQHDDLHDGLTLEPGLIRISMAHGFMRAFDTLKAFEEHGQAFYMNVAALNSQNGKTTEIVRLRKQIWDLEFAANGKQFVLPTASLPPAPYQVLNLAAPQPAVHATVKALKQQLKTLLDGRIAYYNSSPLKNKDGTLSAGPASMPADYATWPTEWEKHSWTPALPL